MPLWESSIAVPRGRLDAEAARRLEVDVRRRLPARDLLRRDRRAEESGDPARPRAPRRSARGSTTRRGRAASARRAAARPRARPGSTAAPSAYRSSIRSTTSRLISSGAPAGRRPRACSATTRASSSPSSSRCAPLAPAAAALARELLANLVPDLLGVDQHAVEVEDDRASRHSGEVAPVEVDERGPGPAQLER